jgi:cytochrome c oxidase cbb3-type subunit 2
MTTVGRHRPALRALVAGVAALRVETRIALTAGLSLTLACGGVDPDDSARVERGLSVFREECARCHGQEGRGDGREAAFLYPKPRNFAKGSFRIASNEGNFPTDSDLSRVIREGMPGSAMPPFPHLTDGESEAVVAAVKHLAVEGKLDEILAMSRERGEPMARADAMALVLDLFAPGSPIVLPPDTAPAETSLARGEELFEKMCSACHAPDSHRVKRDMTDDTGAFLYPRDLNHAFLLRGGSARELALTVTRGLPGTPMPAYDLSAEELWPLVRYVESVVNRDDVVTPSAPSGDARTVTLTGVADPGVWTEDEIELGYRGPATVAPARVILHEGEDVLLILKSADVTHRFYSPELGLGPIEVYPGRPRTVRFRAPAAGNYEFFCTSLCGHCHYSMRGSVRVVAADAKPVLETETEIAPHHCAYVGDLPNRVSVVAKGEAIFRRMQCGECHGAAGRGGVENVNALPTGKVPALERLAESLMFWGPREGDVSTIVDLLGEGVDPRSARRHAPFAHYDEFLEQYDLFHQIVLEGRFTPPKDPAGPEPPLQMPAFQARLRPDEIDAVLAYLLSLSEGQKLETVEQPISFNHALHVVDAGLSCGDCHRGGQGGSLGLPRNVVCQDCHGPDDLEAESSADLVELIRSFERELEIPWVRVHRLADQVRFSHPRHVDVAGLSCERCHGDISTLDRPPAAPFFRQRMSWCLDCHRERDASEDCRACHP